MPTQHPDAHLWTDGTAFASTLAAMLVDRYVAVFEPGPDGRTVIDLGDWDPDAIRAEIADAWGVDSVPRATFDRAMMALAFLDNPSRFYRTAANFVELCNVFSGAEFDPTEFDPADVAECAWGATEMLLLVPPDRDAAEVFGPEVCTYMRAALDAEGMLTAPDVLQVADQPTAYADTASHGPEPEKSILEIDRRKTADITARNRSGIKRLIEQLEGLTLSSGEAKGLRGRILGAAD